MTWESWAIWPPTVTIYGSDKNETTDTHQEEDQAWGVVRLLEREGYGGDRKVFPLKTGVRPVK